MRIEFTILDDQGKVKNSYVCMFGDEAWAFDNIGGYIVSDMRGLAVGESMTLKRIDDDDMSI